MSNILGVITARGGSKTLPGKNIKELGGKPLIAYSIETAKKSEMISHLVVSTDSEEIATVAKKYGADVPFLRPKELATDTAGHLGVMRHAILFMEEKLGIKFDYAVVLQPTSPFRRPEDIDGTLKTLIATGADSAVSLVEVDEKAHPMKMKKFENKMVSAYTVDEPQGTRRQDLPKVYKRSSDVYAQKRDTLIEQNSLYGSKVAGFVVPKERYVDIDTPEDFLVAEYMFKKFNEKNKSQSKDL